MKKTKEQKGITLIALIITIVVLMILAAVAINSITNDGIIGKAESAANKYTEAKDEEQKILDYYQLVLEGTAWTQNGTTVSRKGQTLNVGDEIAIVTGTDTSTAYEANNVSEWRVLGAEYGKLLLVSAENVEDSVVLGGAYGGTILVEEYDDDGNPYISGEYECVAGYYNGVEHLNTLCAAYRNTEYADEARSIKVEDINRVTGYNPETAALGERYIDKYGNKVTYTLADGKVAYASTVESGTSNYTSFTMPDGTALTASKPITLTSSGYMYNGCDEEYLPDTSSDAYKLIFGDGDDKTYWLASDYVICYHGDAIWDIMKVLYGQVDGEYVYNMPLWESLDSRAGACDLGARAVVSLKSNVQVVKV